jgi:hypothetical protein
MSPEEQTFSGKTLEDALAWRQVWFMAPALGNGPFVGSFASRAARGDCG